MKNLILGTVLAGLSSVAFANTSGWYVQGDLGVSKLQGKDSSGQLKDDALTGRVAVGKDTGDVRIAGDYTYFGKAEQQSSIATISHNAEINAHSVGLSAIYDFNTNSTLTPYVGARLGLNKIEFNSNTQVGSLNTSSYLEDKTTVGVGALAGVQYSVNPNIAINAGAEYNYLGKIANDAKVDQYSANVGLRYNF